MTRRIPLSSIRNIGIIAHVDAGKTTLTERILFVSGAIHRSGDVHHGNTTTDSHRIEKKKGITISSAAVTCAWRDHEIHLIDTPGHVDFAVEVEQSLRVLDGAVVVLDAVAGVEPQTESVWRRADKRKLPRVVFVNKLDRAGADFARCVDELATRLRAKPAVIALPWFDGSDSGSVHGDGGALLGVLDLVKRRALRWRDGVAGYAVEPLPSTPQMVRAVAEARGALVAALAEHDERVLAAVVDGRDVDDAVVLESLRAAALAGALVPVTCGAAYKDKGVELVLDAVVDLLPSPADRGSVAVAQGAGDDDDPRAFAADPFGRPLLATAFKVVHDDFGATTLVRVYAGTLAKGSSVVSARSGKRVRIGRIVRVFADKRDDVDEVRAGDIAGLPGLALATGDTLCDADHVVALESLDVDPPVLSLAIEPKARADRDALGTALARLLAEDPSLVVHTDDETGETTLSGMGELHLEVAVEKLATDHGVDVVTGRPRVAYRETVTRAVEHELLWRKQSGGPGQYARVRLRVAPAPRGHGFVFVDEVKGGAVPREFIPAVEKGVAGALSRGVVIGHPLTDVEVALVDGAFHAQDSSEVAFRLCAAACFLEAAHKAEPRVLEPVMTVVVHVAEDRVGDVVGDLVRRRGSVGGVDAIEGDRVVHAEVPLAEMFGYAGDLRGRTQGRGTFTMALARYEIVPPSVAASIRA